MDQNTTEGQGQEATQGMGASHGQSGQERELAFQVATEGLVQIVADSISPQEHQHHYVPSPVLASNPRRAHDASSLQP
jgi:hypothetical protein